LAIGADAVTDACRRGDAALVVVATDAAAAAELSEVRRAIAEGRAVAWGTKRSLGDSLPGGTSRSDGVAVVAIGSARIASALRETIHAADAAIGPARGHAHGHGSDEERGE
jgi:hypothetical protein